EGPHVAGLLLECSDIAELSCGGPPRDLGREAGTFVFGLTHRKVKRDLVVDVAGAAAATQQRQQPAPPADRVMDALHGRMIKRAASPEEQRTPRDPSTRLLFRAPGARAAHGCQ